VVAAVDPQMGAREVGHRVAAVCHQPLAVVARINLQAGSTVFIATHWMRYAAFWRRQRRQKQGRQMAMIAMTRAVR